MDLVPSAVFPEKEEEEQILSCRRTSEKCEDDLVQEIRGGAEEELLLLANANKPDILSVATQWTRIGLESVNQRWNRMQKSNFNR